MGKTRSKTKERHFALNISVGAGVSIVATFFLLMVFAIFTSTGRIPENAMKIITVLSCFISSIVGSRFAIVGTKDKKLLTGVASGALMFILVFAIGRAISAEASAGPLTLALFLAAAIGGALGASIGKKGKKSRR